VTTNSKNGISRLTKAQLIEAIHSQEGTYDTLTERWGLISLDFDQRP